MVDKRASDLFFTSYAPIKIKIEGQIFPGQQADADAGSRAPGGVRPDDAGTDRRLQRRAGNRLRDLRAGPRPLPRQRIPSARQPRDGAALYHRRHAAARRSRAAGSAQGPGDDEARHAADGRRNRLGQVDHARRDDQLPQRELLRPHHHDRGSDRVPALEQEVDHQSARSRPGHQVLRPRPAQRDARRARTCC